MLIKKDNPIFYSLDKIKYSSRRGMLELDIMLKPYIEDIYLQENLEDKKLFIEFLLAEDNDIFDWLFKNVQPPKEYENLVEKIKQAKTDYNKRKL